MAGLRVACPECGKPLVVKDRTLLGRRVKCPSCDHRFVLQETPLEEAELQLAETPVRARETRRQAASTAQDTSQFSDLTQPPSFPNLQIDTTGGVDRLHDIRRRSRKRFITTSLFGLLFLGLLTGGYFLLAPRLPHASPQPASDVVARETVTPSAAEQLQRSADWQARLSPTAGEPIQLLMVPSGARLIVNFRPAELWSNDRQMAELRASLTEDVVNWISTSLKSLCNREPAQIEEVLITWILGARGTPPQMAAVVRLVQDEKLSDLIDEFGGEPLDEFAAHKVYLHQDRAVLIRDTKTIAICPRDLAEDLADTIARPNLDTSDGILDILSRTDRERLLTIICEPADLQRHLENLVPPATQSLLMLATDWLAAHGEAIGWSLHADENFHSELLVRGRTTTSPVSLESAVKSDLKELPRQLVPAIRRMNPQRSGFRKIIGRFPAMMEVFRLATLTKLDGRIVRFITALPPKAAPNLALGTILTWDEASRTDFSAEAPAVASSDVSEPQTVLARLELPVDAEFNRTPLQEAMDYIGGEIGVPIEIDGDALKDAAFTKNMPQTFNLGRVTAREVLAEIIREYKEPGKELVISIDEKTRKIVLLTRKFAEVRGLPVFNFEE